MPVDFLIPSLRDFIRVYFQLTFIIGAYGG